MQAVTRAANLLKLEAVIVRGPEPQDSESQTFDHETQTFEDLSQELQVTYDSQEFRDPDSVPPDDDDDDDDGGVVGLDALVADFTELAATDTLSQALA